MDAKVDYLSFTLPLNLSGVGHTEQLYEELFKLFERAKLRALLDILNPKTREVRSGRKIYGAGLFWSDSAVNIWWGGVANHVLCEISGTGCQLLRDNGTLMAVVKSTQQRCTRIDIAVDLPDAGKPADFVAIKMENRFKVTETMDTDTGWTQYVGSRKSERFARVYLYREPHPRSGVMRVEHVFRGDYAKEVAHGLLATGLREIVRACGNTYGWQHPRWQPEGTTDGKIKAQRHDKEDAATVRWLAKAVAPALVKAHKSGLVDVRKWLDTHVLSQLEDSE